MRAIAAVLCVVLSSGCHSARKDAEEKLAAAEAASTRATEAVGVPTVQGALPRVDARPQLLVTPDAITLDEAPPVIARWHAGADAFFRGTPEARYASLVPAPPARLLALRGGYIDPASLQGGANGYLVESLRARLAAIDPPAHATLRELALVVAAPIPYRTLTRVLYTAGQASWDHFVFVVSDGHAEAGIPFALPTFRQEHVRRIDAAGAAHAEREAAEAERILEQALGDTPSTTTGELPPATPEPAAPPEPEPPPSFDLTVHVARDHVVVSTFGRPEVTLPSLDAEALDEALRRIHAEHEEEHDATLYADDDVPFSAVATAMAALRGRDGRLYPDFALSAGVR